MKDNKSPTLHKGELGCVGNSGSVGVPEVRGKRWKLKESAGGIGGIRERPEKCGPVQDTQSHQSESALF